MPTVASHRERRPPRTLTIFDRKARANESHVWQEVRWRKLNARTTSTNYMEEMMPPTISTRKIAAKVSATLFFFTNPPIGNLQVKTSNANSPNGPGKEGDIQLFPWMRPGGALGIAYLQNRISVYPLQLV